MAYINPLSGSQQSHFNQALGVLVHVSPWVDITAVTAGNAQAGAPPVWISEKRLRPAFQYPAFGAELINIWKHACVNSIWLHPNLNLVDAINVSGVVGCGAIISSPFLRNGNILQYLQAHPHADKVELVRQIAFALEHLHGRHVIHGNVTPNDILVDDGDNVRLSDIGLNIRIRRHLAGAIGAVQIPPSYAYKPPEELMPPNLDDEVPCSETGDVYSFACTVYHIYAGESPARRMAGPHYVAQLIVRPRPLKKPVGMEESLWKTISPCLSSNPTDRPTMGDIHAQLVTIREI